MAKTKHIAPGQRKRKSQVSTEDSGEKPTDEQTGTVCLKEQKEEEEAVESTETKGKDQDEIEPSSEAGEGGQVDELVTVSPSDQTTESVPVKGKRKVESNDDNCESKKIKLINDGYCLYIGNLNRSTPFEDILLSLTEYLVKNSLLFQDIRLERSRKHAYVDFASEMDLNKALGLNGEMLLGQPLKIAQAQVKTADQVKKKKKSSKRKVKHTRCLFLKNLPYTATKEDIMSFFNDVVNVRFPDGTEGPSHGIAFVDFKYKSTARKVQQEKQGCQFQGRDLIVDFAGKKFDAKEAKAEIKKVKAKAPPSNTLFVRNLSINAKQKQLHKIFPDAVNIRLPEKNGKSKGFAFVEFPSVADAEKALQSTAKTKLCKRPIRVQFFEEREKPQKKIDFKTLIVGGLAETTTVETLKNAFEGACSARIPLHKDTSVSRRYGFVEFDSEDICQAARKAMQDCEIDNSKVMVSFAKLKIAKGQTDMGGAVELPHKKSPDQGIVKGKKKSQGGKRPGAASREKKTKDVEIKG